jgi:hypothetical protein
VRSILPVKMSSTTSPREAHRIHPFDVTRGLGTLAFVDEGRGSRGHCRLKAHGHLSIVGSYPAGQEQWDLKHATPADRAIALAQIPKVPIPRQGPIFGIEGPLLALWRWGIAFAGATIPAGAGRWPAKASETPSKIATFTF